MNVLDCPSSDGRKLLWTCAIGDPWRQIELENLSTVFPWPIFTLSRARARAVQRETAIRNQKQLQS